MFLVHQIKKVLGRTISRKLFFILKNAKESDFDKHFIIHVHISPSKYPV